MSTKITIALLHLNVSHPLKLSCPPSTPLSESAGKIGITFGPHKIYVGVDDGNYYQDIYYVTVDLTFNLKLLCMVIKVEAVVGCISRKAVFKAQISQLRMCSPYFTCSIANHKIMVSPSELLTETILL